MTGVVILIAYSIIAVAVFVMEFSVDPVALGVSAMRGAMWPYYVITGKPEG